MLDLVDIGLAIGGRPILHDLNLHVLPGEIHAILGMNGTGKSTLASVVMGLSGYSPTSGKVIFLGEDITALSDGRIAGLMVSHRRILRSNDAPGVHIEGEEIPTGVKAKITVDPGVRVEHPVHLCFGVLPKEGTQEIVSEFLVGEGAKASFLVHCVFPNAVKVRHRSGR